MFSELQQLEIYLMQLEDAVKQSQNISPSTCNYVRRTIELIVNKYCPENLSVIQYIPYPTEAYSRGERLANLSYTLEEAYDLVCSNA